MGGQIPLGPGNQIVLSLGRMTALREIDLSSNTMTVEAGMILSRVQEEAARVGRLFPLSLAAEGSCTIGGNLATNAGGTNVLAYGNARDLVLGLEAVLADGRVLSDLSKLRKNNTGYDLKNLFIGSEGTLGIITAAVLKLYPKPRAIETAFIGLASPRAALALLDLARDMAGGEITTFELIPRIGLDFVLAHFDAREVLSSKHPWYVLLELRSQSRQGLAARLLALLEAANEKHIIEDAAIAASLDQRENFWKLRELLPDAQRHEGGSIKHDVSVPIADIPAFLDEAARAVMAAIPGARLVAFGHLGDGNIHCNVSQPIGADANAFLARWDEINAIVHGLVIERKGSISAGAWDRPAETRSAAEGEGQDRDGGHARDQANPRSKKYSKSRQGALRRLRSARKGIRDAAHPGFPIERQAAGISPGYSDGLYQAMRGGFRRAGGRSFHDDRRI